MVGYNTKSTLEKKDARRTEQKGDGAYGNIR